MVYIYIEELLCCIFKVLSKIMENNIFMYISAICFFSISNNFSVYAPRGEHV